MADLINSSGTGRQPTADNTTDNIYHDKRMQAGLSTQIQIRVQGYDAQWYTVGAITSFKVNETRNISALQEVGTDGIIQLHPNGAAPIEITIDRALFDYTRLTAAFQRGFHHIMNQRFPFDIVVHDYNPYVFGGAKANFDASPYTSQPSISTRYVNCWFKSLMYGYESDNFLIKENASVTCETVYDELIGGTSPAISGSDVVEREADSSRYGHVMTQAYAGITNITDLNT